MVRFASCKPADAFVFLCFWFCAVDKAGYPSSFSYHVICARNMVRWC